MRLATALHRKETLDPRIDPIRWRQTAVIQAPSTFIARSQPRPVSVRLQWREAREVILDFQERIGIALPRSQEQEDLMRCWLHHYKYDLLVEKPPTQVFAEEGRIERYVLQQWAYAISNTFYAVDDLQWQPDFDKNFHNYPVHLGVTWHFARTPQEIYKTAKKIIATCDLVNLSGNHLKAIEANLKREVALCVEDISQISQQSVNPTDLQELAYCIVQEDFLCSISEPSTFQEESTAMPAIVIKRHCLLEHQFQTADIYDAPPVLDDLRTWTLVPTIDQFRAAVIQALFVEEAAGPGVYPLGTWEDHEGLYQGELLFIPPFMPPGP